MYGITQKKDDGMAMVHFEISVHYLNELKETSNGIPGHSFLA
jgi:hypothetical protein